MKTMNIIEAIRAGIAGHNVQRSNGERLVDVNENTHSFFMTKEHLFANDWEIVEQKNMSFMDAMEAMERGATVARRGWYVDGAERKPIRMHPLRSIWVDEESMKCPLPGSCKLEYMDCKSNDWYIVEEKTMTFMEEDINGSQKARTKRLLI
jgi:hypothetical protein